jgi:aminopeptidase YwaD
VGRASRLPVAELVLVLVLGTGCTGEPTQGSGGGDRSTAAPTTQQPSLSQPTVSAAPPPAAPVEFDRTAAMDTVRRLAGGIGPRHATSAAYTRAADVVVAAFREHGYDVRRDGLRVPAGVSWGVPVPAGRTLNVVATPPGFQPDQPHVIVGAHLDTVPQAPGAEDDASGVGVVLELARLAAAEPPELPAVFVAFGAEEPRGPADDEHHFGSRHYVQQMAASQRRALVAMVSLDRVGVGTRVPVCTGGRSPARVQRDLLADASRLGIPSRRCENRTSDHWPFEKAGEAVARIGGNSYAGYHSARDRVGVVRPAQLDRVGRLMWGWLTTGRGGSR